MLTEAYNSDGLPRATQLSKKCSADELPVPWGRRIGLEQEFFLVDRTGAPSDLADKFLWRCHEAAHAEGLDRHCFKKECVKSLVEITTPPSLSFEDLTSNYLSNLNLALEVAEELDLALYSFGTYPLPTRPLIRDDASYHIKARTIGYDRFLHAGRCAGVHLHLELPAETVWPNVKVARKASFAVRRELLDIYNLATALDPALIALTRSCPFYEGQRTGFASRTVHYRGLLGVDGLYARIHEVGSLQPYAESVEDLIEQELERYRAWFKTMDLAGVERRLFARAGGNLQGTSWNPVRLSRHGTIEIRTMDSNYPEIILAVCALICGAVSRLRCEHLKVRASPEVRTLEIDGDELLLPAFSYLSGELLGAAVTGGVEDRRVEAYLDSFFEFASPYVEAPEVVKPVKYLGGGYKTTESEVLGSFPPLGGSVTQYQGRTLVRESCRRLKEQVSPLRREDHETSAECVREKSAVTDVSLMDSAAISDRSGRTAVRRDLEAPWRATANAGPA